MRKNKQIIYDELKNKFSILIQKYENDFKCPECGEKIDLYYIHIFRILYLIEEGIELKNLKSIFEENKKDFQIRCKKCEILYHPYKVNKDIYNNFCSEISNILKEL